MTGRAGEGVGSHVDLGGPGAWVRDHIAALRATIGVIAVLVLVAVDHPTGASVLWIAVGAVIALALLQIFAAAATASPTDG